jgi:hypothetical protein
MLNTFYSVLSPTGRKTGNYSHSTQHRCLGRKWCDIGPLLGGDSKPDLLGVGVYSSGPIWGRIVDSKGPRILLAGAFLFLLSGYSGMRYLYDSGLPRNISSLSIFGFCALVAFSFLTGAGGNAGLISAVNSTAKTFPDQAVRRREFLFSLE